MENEKVKYELHGLGKKDLDFYPYTCLSLLSRSHIMTALCYRNLANPSKKGSLRVPILYDSGYY